MRPPNASPQAPRGIESGEGWAVFNVRGREIAILLDGRVYPPAEDTFLLLDGLRVEGDRALEVGTGSGIVAVFCALEGARVVCTDVNPHALRCARASARLNGVEVEALRADMFEGIRGRFDLVVFNPPHLPTAPSDLTQDPWLDAALCGGPDGHTVARRFLAGLPDHLERDGRAYFVLCDRGAGPLPSRPGLVVRESAERRLDFERLVLEEVRLVGAESGASGDGGERGLGGDCAGVPSTAAPRVVAGGRDGGGSRAPIGR